MTHPHPTDQEIDAYAVTGVQMQRDDDDPETIAIEEHLLWCHGCVNRVEAAEAFTFAMRRATAVLEARKLTAKVSTKVFSAGGN